MGLFPFGRVLLKRVASFFLQGRSSWRLQRSDSVSEGWSVTAPHGGRNREETKTRRVRTEFNMIAMK